MPPLQFVRSQFDGAQPETSAPIQKSDPLRFAFCGRRTHGNVGFHATIASVQTAIAGMCRGEAEIFDDADISVAAASMFR